MRIYGLVLYDYLLAYRLETFFKILGRRHPEIVCVFLCLIPVLQYWVAKEVNKRATVVTLLFFSVIVT